MYVRVYSTSYLFIILFIFLQSLLFIVILLSLWYRNFPCFSPSGHKERSHGLCLFTRPFIPDLLSIPSFSLFILPHWISSFTAIIITMATRCRHPTRKGIMGHNRLLSQLTCTIWLVLCQGLVVQKSYCFANMVRKQLTKTNYCFEDIYDNFNMTQIVLSVLRWH